MTTMSQRLKGASMERAARALTKPFTIGSMLSGTDCQNDILKLLRELLAKSCDLPAAWLRTNSF
jgi:hypothetical protein